MQVLNQDICAITQNCLPKHLTKGIDCAMVIEAMEMTTNKTTAKFHLGKLLMSRGVFDKARSDPQFAVFITQSLKRHSKGDWGDLSPEDKTENDFSLDKHLRLLSAYENFDESKIWIITEADRSATTILFPEEY